MQRTINQETLLFFSNLWRCVHNKKWRSLH